MMMVKMSHVIVIIFIIVVIIISTVITTVEFLFVHCKSILAQCQNAKQYLPKKEIRMKYKIYKIDTLVRHEESQLKAVP